jgi:hypothetical protein
MTQRTIRNLIVSSALVLCVFFTTEKAHASTIFDTDTGSHATGFQYYVANFTPGNSHYGSYNFGNLAVPQSAVGVPYTSPTLQPVMQSLTIWVVRRNMLAFHGQEGYDYTGHYRLQAHDFDGSSCTSNNYIENTDLPEETPTLFTFDFAGCTDPFSPYAPPGVQKGIGSLEMIDGTNPNGYSPVLNANGTASSTNPSLSGSLAYTTDTTSSCTSCGNSNAISFNPQYFVDGVHTPDFKNFWLTTNPGASGQYDYGVLWGTSTPGDIANFDQATDWGNTPLTAGSNNLLPLVKTASSTPGNYVMEAYLLFWNGSSYATVATSSILNITINGGTPIVNPNNAPGYVSGGTQANSCQPTNFTLLGIDFGKGVCDTVVFLFVPNSTTLNNSLQNTTGLFQTRIPFSYYYDMTTALEASTSSGSVITSLSFSTAIGNNATITYSPLSASAAEALVGVPTYNLYQTLMSYAVLAGFGFYVFIRIKDHFNKPVE